LVAHCAIFFERFLDDALELGWNCGIQTDGRNGSAIENGFEDYAGRGSGKRHCAGGHFVENGAERKKIGAAIEVGAANLLGGHVGDGADGATGTGEQIFGGDEAGGDSGAFGDFLSGGRELGEAEVHDFCVAAGGDEKIGGLDVAMDDAGGVGGVEAVGNLDAPIEERFDVERAAGDIVFQSLAVEKFHGDEVAAFEFVNFVDGANIRVIQGGGGLRFTLETFQSLRVAGEIFGEKFERDEAAELGVFGFVDDAHSAAAEFFQDAVVGDGLADHRLFMRRSDWAHMLGYGVRTSQREWKIGARRENEDNNIETQ